MKKLLNKKRLIISILGLVSASLISLAAVSCDTNPKHKTTISNWDSNITITYSYANKGFNTKDPQTQKTPKDLFLEKLQTKFNALKNADKNLKNNSDVQFDLAELSDHEIRKNNLLADVKSEDVSIIPYKTLGDKIDKTKLSEYPIYIGNTATLAFKWSLDDELYTNGTDEDPLIKGAKKNNEIYFSSQNGEFSNWWKLKKQLKWDGSKYKAFYDENNKVTQFYRGAIYISGDDKQLEAIENAWKTHNWAEFSKYGIIYEKTTSLSGFKLQANIIAKHFNLTPIEVIKYFTNQENKDNKKVELNADLASRLGKKDNYGHAFHIGFEAEGILNWTESVENEDKFKPTDENAKIRVLTLTNPIPYEAVFIRSGLSIEQGKLIMKALSELSIEENTFGIYTGYNKFIKGDNEAFKKYIDLFNTNTLENK